MTNQEIFVTQVDKRTINNSGANSITNHLLLYLETSQRIQSCHLDSVCFTPDHEPDKYIVTVVVSDITRVPE